MKLNIQKTEAIEAELNKVQSRAKKRLTDHSEIVAACEKAEQKLSGLGIPKKAWPDCTLEILPEKVCHAYARKGTAEGTYVEIRRFPSGWFVVGMYRRQCGSCAGGAYPESRLTLGATAIDAMPKSFSL